MATQKKLKSKEEKLENLVFGSLPPQAKELEQIVLGSMLLEKNALQKVIDILKPDEFYVDVHQVLYKAFLRLVKRFEPVDLFTVFEELRNSEELSAVGGASFLTSLTMKVNTTAHVVAHANIIHKKYLQRKLIEIGTTLVSDAFEDAVEVSTLLDGTTANLYDLTKGFFKKDFVSPADYAIKFKTELDERMMREVGTLTGVPSRFTRLDECTFGWQPSDLIILAARPAVGKTALALNLAINAATSNKRVPVGFFSLEMSGTQLIARIISTLSEIHLTKISRGDLNVIEKATVDKAVNLFADIPIFIDDTAHLNMVEFKAKARRLVEEFGVGLIILDYLQLMQPSEYSTNKNKNDQIGEISRDIKVLAKELNVPIIALSQLTRGIETRTEEQKTPKLSDLRDSGAIEQDADVVIFLFDDKSSPVLRIAKHRNGELTFVALKKDLSIQKFSDNIAEPYRPKIAKTGFNFNDGIEEAENEFSFKSKNK